MQRKEGGRSMEQPRIFFAVALHEKYALPTDALYTPIQAGAAIHPPLGLMRDDTGENISAKNGSYCELTVLYWMAHNVDADWYGLCHYRRYFSLRRTGCPQKRILTRAQLLPLLDTADIFCRKNGTTGWKQISRSMPMRTTRRICGRRGRRLRGCIRGRSVCLTA